jgi:hypothetical protein
VCPKRAASVSTSSPLLLVSSRFAPASSRRFVVGFGVSY